MTIKNFWNIDICRLRSRICLIVGIFFGLSVYSQETDIDENDLFSDSVSIVDSSLIIKKDLADISEIKSFGISGEITAFMEPSLRRAWFQNDMKSKDARFSSFITGVLSFDIRLPGGIKAFANTEARYNPGMDSTFFGIRELFIDVNIHRTIYFRLGKQVLQWGRCFFWNPTDLINVEKKSFLTKIGSYEGTYGLKVHTSFGTNINVYGFVDTRNALVLDSISGTAKFEFMVAKTEMSLSLWGKRGHGPVFAYDVSTGIFDFLLNGEVALYQEFLVPTLSFNNGNPQFSHEVKNWIPRACIGISRYFTIQGIPDRLMTVIEFYYNHPGTDVKVIPIPNTVFDNDTLSQLFLASGLYEPHNLSRYYLSFFTTFQRFIHADMSLFFNIIGNLNQESAIIAIGMNYTNIHNLYVELLGNGYLGRKKTEYTMWGNGLAIQLKVGFRF